MNLHHQTARAIRRFCLECQGGSSSSVTLCNDDGCYLFCCRNCTTTPIFAGENPLRCIRKNCMECAGSREDVRRCDAKNTCSLWSYRFGVLPSTFKRVMGRVKKHLESLTLPGL